MCHIWHFNLKKYKTEIAQTFQSLSDIGSNGWKQKVCRDAYSPLSPFSPSLPLTVYRTVQYCTFYVGHKLS